MQKTPGKFELLEADVDGHPLIAMIDMSLRKFKGKSRMPWFLSLSTPLSKPDSRGLPSQKEAEELNQWEDSIEADLASSCKYAFVGRVTCDGHRELLYYIDQPEPAVPHLQELINRRTLRPFAFRCEQDPGWSAVSIYLES